MKQLKSILLVIGCFEKGYVERNEKQLFICRILQILTFRNEQCPIIL